MNTQIRTLEHILHHFDDGKEAKRMKQLSELVDTKVLSASGEPVGSVDELVLNCKTGKIDRVIVKTHDHKRFSLDWADLIVRGHEFLMKKDVQL